METMELLRQIDALGEEGSHEDFVPASITLPRTAARAFHEIHRRIPRRRPDPETARGSQKNDHPQLDTDGSLRGTDAFHHQVGSRPDAACARSNLVHGPGCPVCVTPLEQVDKAIALASLPEVIFTSYGDMLRVPGSKRDLFAVKAAGGDVRIVYSPLDALKIAKDNPNKTVVFFAIGFETTAPANAMAVLQAKAQGLDKLRRAGLARDRPGGDQRLNGFARRAGGRVPGSRSRLHGDGDLGIRTAGREVQNPDRGDRLRAGGPAARDLEVRPAVGGRHAHGGECLRTVGQPGRQPTGPGRHPESLRDDRPGLARHRRHPDVGLPPAPGIRRLRRRSCASRKCRRSRRRSPRCASAGWCCRGARNPASARRSARNAPRRPRSGQPWSRPKAPARRITGMDDIPSFSQRPSTPLNPKYNHDR